jgi:hypothetical protein
MALVVILGFGCTASDDDQRAVVPDALLEVVADGVLSTMEPGSVAFTAAKARCYAEGIVDVLGIDRVESAGISVDSTWDGDLDDLSLMPRERTLLMDALGGCVDLQAQAAAILRDAFGLPPELAECVADRYLASDAARDNFTMGDVVEEGLEERTTAAMQDAMDYYQAEVGASTA